MKTARFLEPKMSEAWVVEWRTRVPDYALKAEAAKRSRQ